MIKKVDDARRLKWFAEARFGMFIHWGVYSVAGRGEWAMFQERIPSEEYAELADKFRPKTNFADEWVALAKEAGMRYMVLTTRHHDGFSLFDSKVSDFTAPETLAGRDLVREYVRACRKGGMRVGFYYSPPNWRFPSSLTDPEKDPEGHAKWSEFVLTQIRELCSGYGKIDLFWFDGANPRPEETAAILRSLQPEAVVNNRGGLPGDFDTPEKEIKPSPPGRPWESCLTMNEHWGYYAGDRQWKSVGHLIHWMVTCASCDGNFLLNVGPKADGTFPIEAVRILKGLGKWLKTNGESIYGTRCSTVSGGSCGATTARGNRVYLHALHYPGSEICITSEKAKIRSARLLASGKPVEVKQKGDRVSLSGLPAKAPDPNDTVIVLEVEGFGESI